MFPPRNSPDSVVTRWPTLLPQPIDVLVIVTELPCTDTARSTVFPFRLIEHGKHLRAGDVVLTGTVHPPVFLPGPGVAKTEFLGFGGTEITIK